MESCYSSRDCWTCTTNKKVFVTLSRSRVTCCASDLSAIDHDIFSFVLDPKQCKDGSKAAVEEKAQVSFCTVLVGVGVVIAVLLLLGFLVRKRMKMFFNRQRSENTTRLNEGFVEVEMTAI